MYSIFPFAIPKTAWLNTNLAHMSTVLDMSVARRYQKMLYGCPMQIHSCLFSLVFRVLGTGFGVPHMVTLPEKLHPLCCFIGDLAFSGVPQPIFGV